MFVRRISASDKRFKTVEFRDGLNILVADRTETSDQGDSRNSVGKTSLVKIFRYLLGGSLPTEFRTPDLGGYAFIADLELPAEGSGGTDQVVVTRRVKPQNQIGISGWSVVDDDISVEQWRTLLAHHVFGLDESVARPTTGQLWGQLIRTYFDRPTKTHHAEADWETGLRIGHLLGLSASVLAESEEVVKLAGQSAALKKATSSGAIRHLDIDEAQTRSQLAAARSKMNRTKAALAGFRVDEQYVEHQERADQLTGQIQALNTEGISLQRRLRELESALHDEVNPTDEARLQERLTRAYAEVGLMLPELVERRYEEVAEFHQSVVSNRRAFLDQERESAESRLAEIESERGELDEERSRVLQLLRESVALDTFLAAQQDAARLEVEVGDLERKLEMTASIQELGDRVKVKTAEVTTSIRSELRERTSHLEHPISLFSELGAEIYTDREASLLLEPGSGALRVRPRVSGDASTGVRNVETFILDMVCITTALQAGRSPGLLVHDSHLFDAIDGRQIASCLNVGARLAEESSFQYLVTLNSDTLDLVESQSDGAFDAEPYILDTRLTDATEDGGLFGFRFD
ncbi:MAG: ABC-three component system protein [Dehalococcoidia bacterium]